MIWLLSRMPEIYLIHSYEKMTLGTSWAIFMLNKRYIVTQYKNRIFRHSIIIWCMSRPLAVSWQQFYENEYKLFSRKNSDDIVFMSIKHQSVVYAWYLARDVKKLTPLQYTYAIVLPTNTIPPALSMLLSRLTKLLFFVSLSISCSTIPLHQ